MANIRDPAEVEHALVGVFGLNLLPEAPVEVYASLHRGKRYSNDPPEIQGGGYSRKPMVLNFIRTIRRAIEIEQFVVEYDQAEEDWGHIDSIGFSSLPGSPVVYCTALSRELVITKGDKVIIELGNLVPRNPEKEKDDTSTTTSAT